MDVSVDEAARRLKVSVATVRRKLAAGEIAGRKVGRSWLVDSTRLPAVRSGSGSATAATYSLDMKLALQHIKNTDLAELWVPDVLRWEDYISQPGELLAEAASRAATSRWDGATEVVISKTPVLSRPVSLLAVEDRVAYQALVLAIANKVDPLTSDRVYSSRRAKGKWFLKRATRQWVEWRKEVRRSLKSYGPWLVKTDLVSYFDSIDHAILFSELGRTGVHPKIVSSLRNAIETWATVRGRGIPIGPNASRVLGNFFLLPVDEVMLDAGYDYWRYMDDVRIVAKSKAEAVEAMRLFDRECRKRGLTVSSAKTELLAGPEAESEAEDQVRQDAQYLLDSKQFLKARRELRKIFSAAVKGDGHVDVGRAKFSLWRLTQIIDRGPLRKVLERLEDFAPVASVSASYLRAFLTRAEVETALSEFLADPDRNSSAVLEAWLMAAMLEHPGTPPTAWTAHARALAQNRNTPAFLRVVAVNLMMLADDARDVVWVKGELRREYDPELVRGYATALARVGSFDRSTSRALAARFPALRPTVNYLQNRQNLPSLVWRGNYVSIR